MNTGSWIEPPAAQENSPESTRSHERDQSPPDDIIESSVEVDDGKLDIRIWIR